MALMTTSLESFETRANGTRIYIETTKHTNGAAFNVSQKKRVPDRLRGQVVQEDTIVIYADTTDADGILLPQKAAVEIRVKRPINGSSAVMSSVLETSRDIMASDEMSDVVDKSLWLKP